MAGAGAEIAGALRGAGFAGGRDLLVHSAYRAVKARVGAQELIEALAEAVGPRCRLFFPALSYEGVTAANPVFDTRLTPSCVGYLSELFRTRYAEARSEHPTHSASGLGPGVRELLEAHGLDSTPVGPRSPFSALRDSGGAILMLGCGLEPCTSMHGVEELADAQAPGSVDYLFGPEIDYRLVAADGTERVKRYRSHGFARTVQRYDRIESILEAPELVRFELLGAECWLIDAPSLWRKALEAMRRDSRFFVDAE